MLAKLLSGTIAGFEPLLVEVEVDIAGGLPSFTLVGLPDTSVNEARERVRAALKNAGFELPARRITVNLAPADVRKEGAGLDVPLAIALLTALGVIPAERVEGLLFLGETSLAGELRHARGVLPLSLLAKEKNLRGVVVPQSNVREAAAIPGLPVYGFAKLEDLIRSLKESETLPLARVEPMAAGPLPAAFQHVDLAEIKGQSFARRALEIAAAGGHNLLMAGPPGAGKTLLARAFASLLPPLSFEESLEVSRIYSVKGLLPPECGLVQHRPFRDPHHTISDVALIGGGRIPAPGEVSLAHHGVLFLDEIPEFRKSVLEVLRQPLSEGSVAISRAAQTVAFPARFLLLAAMNPCPCGFSGDPLKPCACSAHQVRTYQQKLSGPLLDRIDLQIPVPRLKPEELSGMESGEPSARVADRVKKARHVQTDRQGRAGLVTLNAHLTPRDLKRFAELDTVSRTLLSDAARRFGLSARAFDKIIRVSRTIADLEGIETIQMHHVAEAIQYRTIDPFASI